jgi:hypothetical protein
MSADPIEHDALLILSFVLNSALNHLPEPVRTDQARESARTAIGEVQSLLARDVSESSRARAVEILDAGLAPLRARGFAPRFLYTLATVANLRPNAIPKEALPALADLLKFACETVVNSLCYLDGRSWRSEAVRSADRVFTEAERRIGDEVLYDWPALLARLQKIDQALCGLYDRGHYLVLLGARLEYAAKLQKEKAAGRSRRATARKPRARP